MLSKLIFHCTAFEKGVLPVLLKGNHKDGAEILHFTLLIQYKIVIL